MTTYTKEPGYIYIETEEDRKRYAPKLKSDEFLSHYNYVWDNASNDGLFQQDYIYRRPIAANDWQYCDEGTVLPSDVTDYTHLIEVYCESDGFRKTIDPSLFRYRDSDTSHYRLIELIPAPAVKLKETQLEKDQKKAAEAGFWPGDQIAAFVKGAEYGRNDRHETCG